MSLLSVEGGATTPGAFDFCDLAALPGQIPAQVLRYVHGERTPRQYGAGQPAGRSIVRGTVAPVTDRPVAILCRTASPRAGWPEWPGQ